MADPLSLLATVIGIIDPIFTRVNQLVDRFETFKDLLPSAKHLRHRLTVLNDLFPHIREHLHTYQQLPEPHYAYISSEIIRIDTNIDILIEQLVDIETELSLSTHRCFPQCRLFSRTGKISEQLKAAINHVEYMHATATSLIQIFVSLPLNHKNQPSDSFQPTYTSLAPSAKHSVVTFSLEGTTDAELQNAILSCSSVVLHGPGGVGKTTLAVELSHLPITRATFPGGIYFMHFGKQAPVDSPRPQLAAAVRASGGISCAEDIATADSPLLAANRSAEWFTSRRALFIIDDIWPSSRSSVGHVDVLRVLATPTNAVLYTTRHRNIANMLAAHTAAVKRIEIKPELDVCGPRASRMLFSHADAPPLALSLSQLNDFHTVLRCCNGIPLALAVAGSAIEFARSRQGADTVWTDGLREYARRQREFGCTVAEDDFRERPAYNFKATITTCLDSADEWALELCRRHGDATFSVSELFQRLCVLPRRSSTPESVLHRLWPEISPKWAARLVDKLYTLHLMVRVPGLRGLDGYQLNDLVLDCIESALRSSGKFQMTHRNFLASFWSNDYMQQCQTQSELRAEQFSTEALQQATRPWWSIREGKDIDFLFSNLACLLLRAGFVTELVGLLSSSSWIQFRASTPNGSLLLQQEYDLAIEALSGMGDDAESRKIIDALRLMRGVSVESADMFKSDRYLGNSCSNTGPILRILSTAATQGEDGRQDNA